MYKVSYTKKFEKSLKLCQKRGLNIELAKSAIEILETDGKLPDKFKPHKLSGNYEGLWECHLKSDWLLIWSQNDTELLLIMTDTGTHSDLF
ncbi:MAG: type II toxin-antitoxin system YafQ family toxin [Bacteroidales bacterium]|nr:type II toxin-antitoxin system YafQ family toxin [Bacteroidales bacterium]